MAERIKAPVNGRLSRHDLRRKVRQKIGNRPLGWLVYATGAARWHDDGDGVNAVFRWWHPLSWVLLAAMLIPCAVVGEPLKDAVPFRVTKWWRERPERINWL